MSLIWSEKYRPKTVEECAAPARIKEYFKEMISRQDVENMTFVGPAGTGKTTMARAICEELGFEYIIINASENGNIDTLRTTVRNFASTVSFESKLKVIILDEADGLNPQSTQPALRGAIEEFAKNCRFILTANYDNKIITPIKSRAPVVDFSISKEERIEVIPQIQKRVRQILQEENIQYDKNDIPALIIRYFPDFRLIINHIQRFSSSGELKITGGGALDEKEFNNLVKLLSARDFTGMRKWVAENLSNNGADLRRQFYDKMVGIIKPESTPQLVLTLSEYDYKENFVVDKEINTVAMLTEIMSNISFR